MSAPAADQSAEVAGVERDDDVVRVHVRLYAHAADVPAQVERPVVVAGLADLSRTRLPVDAVELAENMLHVTVRAEPGVNRMWLRIERPVRATLDVALQEKDPAFDPAAPPAAAGAAQSHVLVDYGAKDFPTFKQLMLDSISHELPRVTERHEADVGIAVIEVLAFAADQLSYYQDAVATETYLQTARRRVSVRRHARMIGYRVHDGCTPRVWLQLTPKHAFVLQAGYQAMTGLDDLQQQRVFETLEPIALDPRIGELRLSYEHHAVVARGATSAYLAFPPGDEAPPADALTKGTVLIFEQRLDPVTGRRPSPKNRQAVRLAQDAHEMPPSAAGARIVHVAWYEDDRLTFDAPVTKPGAKPATVVLGNIVAADFGETIPPDPGAPQPVIDSTWSMRLPISGLTFAVPYAERDAPAARMTDIKPYKAVPAIAVSANALGDTATWTGARDLLGAGPYDRRFAVEVERDGLVVLRFGDGVNGWRPDPRSSFHVVYRSGHGLTGHVGADTIVYGDAKETRVVAVRNPLPAAGGEDRLDLVKAKREAPELIREQRRCVADADYVRVAQSVRDVSACVERRWNGTSEVVQVYVHAAGGDEHDDQRKRAEVAEVLERNRLIGVAVDVRAPRRVGVVAQLDVRFRPPGNESDVAQRVAAQAHEALRRQQLALGKRLFASWLVDAALAVPGVTDVTLARFERWDGEDARARGFITMGPTEVPVLVDLDGTATGGRPLVTAAEAR